MADTDSHVIRRHYKSGHAIGSIPELGRFPEREWQPFQYSCLKRMDREPGKQAVHEGKEPET